MAGTSARPVHPVAPAMQTDSFRVPSTSALLRVDWCATVCRDGRPRHRARVPRRPRAVRDRGRMRRGDFAWWLYDSAALAVRGIAVAPRDVDLHVADPFAAGRLFEER